jgi:hypothetical protein
MSCGESGNIRMAVTIRMTLTVQFLPYSFNNKTVIYVFNWITGVPDKGG